MCETAVPRCEIVRACGRRGPDPWVRTSRVSGPSEPVSACYDARTHKTKRAKETTSAHIDDPKEIQELHRGTEEPGAVNVLEEPGAVKMLEEPGALKMLEERRRKRSSDDVGGALTILEELMKMLEEAVTTISILTPLAHCIRRDPVDLVWGGAAMHCGSIRCVGSVGSVKKLKYIQRFRQRRIRHPIKSDRSGLADVCLCKDHSPIRQPRLPSSVDGRCSGQTV